MRTGFDNGFFGLPAGGIGYLVKGWFTDPSGHVAPGFSQTSGGGSSSLGNGPLANALSNGSPAAINKWLAVHHYSYWISYTPRARLPLLEAVWSAGVLAVAAAVFAAAIWQVYARR
jgi:hypothetical protein